MSKVEIVSRVRILDGFFKIDEVEFHHQRADGRMSPVLRRFSLDRGDGVAVVIHNTEADTVVLVRQFRYSTYDKGPGWMLELAAGVIDSGQSPEHTMRREVMEETGYRVGDSAEFIGSYYLTPGGSSERILLYYCQVASADRLEAGGGLEEEGEDIEIVELPLSELWDLLDKGGIVDAKTAIGLQWLRHRDTRSQ